MVFVFFGCATESSYDTFQMRTNEYNVTSITLQDGGLTKDQIDAIINTKLTEKFPVCVSLIVMKNGYIAPDREKILITALIKELQLNDRIARITPIPAFLLPQSINFARIQELGIRTLSEYVLILYLDAATLFKWTAIVETELEIESIIDFLIVDSQTTAIIAADKLYSSIIYRESIFKKEEKAKAEQEIFTEQGEILGEKIRQLFNQ